MKISDTVREITHEMRVTKVASFQNPVGWEVTTESTAVDALTMQFVTHRRPPPCGTTVRMVMEWEAVEQEHWSTLAGRRLPDGRRITEVRRSTPPDPSGSPLNPLYRTDDGRWHEVDLLVENPRGLVDVLVKTEETR